MKAAVVAGQKIQVVFGSRLADYVELMKVRLTLLVLSTTLIGFLMGVKGQIEIGLMVSILISTGLVAAGAAVLNQWMERDSDAKMRRTRNRPLPAGRIKPEEAFLFGCVLSMAGIVSLMLLGKGLAGFLSVFTLGSYLLIYTPLKRISWTNTIVGALIGAIPPMIGWVGACDELSVEAWVLFSVMFFWQVPHFLAIAWLYREDYAMGGLQMLSVSDPSGGSTARQSVIHAMLLLPVSLLPCVLGLAGHVYFISALGAGSLYVFFAGCFARDMTRSCASALFKTSLIYLPFLLGVMVFDKS